MSQFDQGPLPSLMPEVTRHALSCFALGRRSQVAVCAWVLWLAVMHAAPSQAQLDKISLLPVQLSSQVSNDIQFKQGFASSLRTHLQGLSHARLEEMTDSVQSEISSLDDYHRREHMRYVVTGSLVAIANSLRVSLTVTDGGRIIFHAKHMLWREDVKPLLNCFDRLARLAAGAIERASPREIVYTYCFSAPSLSDTDPRRLVLENLPLKLQSALRTKKRFHERYEFNCVTQHNPYLCNQAGDLDSKLRKEGLYLYDYIITGVLTDNGLTAEIIMEDGEKTVPLDPPVPLHGHYLNAIVARITNWSEWKR